MSATAIVQVYYPEREPNLPQILASIQDVPEIEKVIIWVNGGRGYGEDSGIFEHLLKDGRIEMIPSSFDSLVGQYAAAFLAPTDLIYCQNDDLIVDPKSIQSLLDEAQRRPDSMVGIIGRNFIYKDWALPYAAGTAVGGGPADCLIGRAWAARKSALIPAFTRSLSHNVYPGRGEDLFFSWKHAWVVPGLNWTDIPENGIGLCHEAGHSEEREKWARWLLEHA